MNRRGFMKAAGVGAVACAVPLAVVAAKPSPLALFNNPDAQGAISLNEYAEVTICYVTTGKGGELLYHNRRGVVKCGVIVALHKEAEVMRHE
jgi:hypothetical protein